MAPDQIYLKLREPIGRNCDLGELPESCRDTVDDIATRDDRVYYRARPLHAFSCSRSEPRRSVRSYRIDVAESQRSAVQRDIPGHPGNVKVEGHNGKVAVVAVYDSEIRR